MSPVKMLALLPEKLHVSLLRLRLPALWFVSDETSNI